MHLPEFMVREAGERRPYATGGWTLGDVRRLAAMGEGARVEFKRRVPEGNRLAKEVVALANTRGGRLLLGVSDEGEVVGLRDSEEEEFSLRQTLESYCRPAVPHVIHRIPVSRRRDVIVIEVPESRSKPHYVVDEDAPERRTAYVRVADMSQEASRETLRLLRSREDQDVRFEFGEKELTLMRYLEEYGRITVEQFARLADLKTRAASHTLVLLTRGDVLAHHVEPGGEYFTLAASRTS